MSEPETAASKEIREETDRDLKEWIRSIASRSEGAFKIEIVRRRPKMWKGVACGGMLETVEDLIDDQYLREHHGGGTYDLKIKRQGGEKGLWSYGPQRSIEIAGAPKIEGLVPDEPMAVAPAARAEVELAKVAMKTMQDGLVREQERMERMEARGNHSDGNMEMLRALNEPLVAQLQSVMEQNRDLQTKIHDILANANRRPESGLQDRILEKMVDGESARIDALRTQHDSELRSLRENARHEVGQLREQHAEDLRQRERQHEREIDTIKQSYETQIKSGEVAYSARVDGLKAEADRLNRELGETRARAATLEAKKDKSLTEQAEEIVKVQEAFKALGVGGDAGEDSPWYERVIEALGNSEVVGKMLGVGGSPEQQQAAMLQQMAPPPGVPFRAPDGQVYVRDEQNQVRRIDPRQLQAGRRKKAAANGKAKAESEAPAAGPNARPPDPDELAIAIRFLEGALRNDTPPETLMRSAMAMVPGDILEYLRSVGVEKFLETANIKPSTPLASQHGRNYVRKLAKLLIGDEEGAAAVG